MGLSDKVISFRLLVYYMLRLSNIMHNRYMVIDRYNITCIPKCNRNNKFIIYIAREKMADFETQRIRNWARIQAQPFRLMK